MPAEIERRFLVLKIDPTPLARAKRWSITQGYFELPNSERSLRVRIVEDDDGRKSFLTAKQGQGISRDEEESPIDLRAAQILGENSWHTIQKTRFFCNGWEVDFYEEPLKGLIIAEFEMTSLAQEVILPPWILEAIEVTESITNLHLARLATELRHAAADASGFSLHEELLKTNRRVPRIVLTGGPCSGKSTLLEVLRREFGDAIHCVPETATIIISQVGIKPLGSPLAFSRFQDTVHRVQRIFEGTSLQQAANEGKRVLVLDRGSVDNAAYLSGGLLEMTWRFSTTPQAEYARYDLVLCLDVPPEHVFEASRTNNPARSETYSQAVALGERIKEVWGEHPHLIVVPNGQNWEEKKETALHAIRDFLAASPEPS